MNLLFRPRFATGVTHNCTIPRGRMELGGRALRVRVGPPTTGRVRYNISLPDLVPIREPDEPIYARLPRGRITMRGRVMRAYVTEHRYSRIAAPQKRMQIRGYPMRAKIDYDEKQTLRAVLNYVMMD